MTGTPGISDALAARVANSRFDEIPPAAISAAKASFIDALGVSLAASTLGEGCDAFAEIARANGIGPCSLLGHGTRVQLLPAVLANGALAHAIDFEDALDGAPVHPNAAVMPAALALSEQLRCDGKALLTALVIGCDITCRMGRALTINPDELGWYPPPILSAFGAAAAAASLLQLNQTQVVDTFSLLLTQTGCSNQFKTAPESMIRGIRDAIPAHAGTLAALLAARGVRGFPAPIEGPSGFYALFAQGRYDPERLLKQLDSYYLGVEVSLKPWPSCRGTHGFVEAALRLREHADVTPLNIRRIVLRGHPLQQMLVNPAQQKQLPSTAIDAKFSLPYTVARALVHGELSLRSFDAAALSDSTVLGLAARVVYETDRAAGERWNGDTVVCELEDGTEQSEYIEFPRGHPSRPMSSADTADKFIDCAGYANQPLAVGAADEILETVARLEQVADCGAAFAALGDGA